MRHLCETSTSPADARRRLQELSKSLLAFYEQTMQRIERDNRGLSKRIFSFLLFSRRALSLRELRHAHTSNRGISELDLTAVENMLEMTYGLIKLDTKGNTVELVHKSFQDYLLKHSNLLLLETEIELAKTCISHLSQKNFDSGPVLDITALAQRLDTYPFFEYATSNWGYHASVGQDDILDMLLVMLKSDKRLDAIAQVLFVSEHRSERRTSELSWSTSPQHTLAYWGLEKVASGIDPSTLNSWG